MIYIYISLNILIYIYIFPWRGCIFWYGRFYSDGLLNDELYCHPSHPFLMDLNSNLLEYSKIIFQLDTKAEHRKSRMARSVIYSHDMLRAYNQSITLKHELE